MDRTSILFTFLVIQMNCYSGGRSRVGPENIHVNCAYEHKFIWSTANCVASHVLVNISSLMKWKLL